MNATLTCECCEQRPATKRMWIHTYMGGSDQLSCEECNPEFEGGEMPRLDDARDEEVR